MSEAVNSVAAEEKKTIVTKKDLLKAWWEMDTCSRGSGKL